MSVMRVTALTCYPVKGLAGIQIRDCHLASAQLFSNDRRYALALDEQGKESWQGSLRRPWAKKRAFANLVNQPALARLAIAYASLESNLKICHEGKVLVQGCLQVADDCQRIAQAITAFVKTDKPFQLVEIDQKGQSANGAATSGSTTSGFTDSPYALLSLVNQASIEAIGRICGAQIDPARFRANIMIEGAEASAEYSWIGARVRIGEAIGRVVAPIERCAATNVNPADGQVDLNIPLVLRRHFGSIKMGVFIQIDHPGLVKLTDRLILCQ